MEDLKETTDTKLKEMKQFNEGLMELETNRNKSESRISFLERQLGEGQERVLRAARHSNTGLAVPAEWVERAGRRQAGLDRETRQLRLAKLQAGARLQRGEAALQRQQRHTRCVTETNTT